MIENRCIMIITALSGMPRAEQSSWYELWGAEVAINAMCIGAGTQGASHGIGLEGRLSIEIGDVLVGDNVTATA